jgi:hypothetical protein
MGVWAIARKLRDEGVPPLGKDKWLPELVDTILHNRAVLGERVSLTGKPTIYNYYPVIISQIEWDRAHAAIAKRNRDYPGKKGKGGSNCGGRLSDWNLFAGKCIRGPGTGGLLRDMTPPLDHENGICMGFSGVKPKAWYYKSQNGMGGTSNTLPYHPFKKAFFGFLKDLDWESIVRDSKPPEVIEKEKCLNDLAHQIAQKKTHVAALEKSIKDFSEEPEALSSTLRRFARTEAEIKALENEKTRTEGEIANELAKVKHLENIDEFKRLINAETPTSSEARIRLRTAINDRIARINLVFRKNLAGEREVVTDVIFINQMERRMVPSI